MIYIYIELPYQRQLHRICPDVLTRFFAGIVSSVKKNGGIEIRVASGHLYQFDANSVGYAFAASRVIVDISDLLREHSGRIKEYFILTDYLETPVSGDSFIERLSPYSNVILPSDAILLTPAAASQLELYISTIPLPAINLKAYSSHLIENVQDKGLIGGIGIPTLSIYTDFAEEPIKTFRNLIGSLSISKQTKIVAQAGTDSLSESRYALDMYGQFRFSVKQPEYRVTACEEYLCSFFRTLKHEEKGKLSIILYGKKALPSSFKDILEKMQDFCECTTIIDPGYMDTDLTDVPDELIELSYLLCTTLKYFFIDEIPEFFIFLGKQPDFLNALGTWMQSFGILSDSRDFRSFNPFLIEKIIARAANQKDRLDLMVSRFLWSKYQAGQLQCDFSLYEVFTRLNFIVPDSFLVSCLCHSRNTLHDLSGIRKVFKNSLLIEAFESLELAKSKYDAGQLDESSVLAKKVLHVFQKEGVLAGEYRSLSLIAMLSLARKSCDDSIVYLEYALQNAERMNDPYAMLCTRFDMAMVYFINGNFHFAICALEAVEKLISTCYAKDWEILLFFMKGRISFELGNYHDSELLFQTSASLASVNLIPESVALCRVWYARSLVHLSRFATAENVLSSCIGTIPEAYIFLLEASLLSGRIISSVNLPESLISLSGVSDCWTIDAISWTSGFSLAEDRCYESAGENKIAVRMYEAFYLYYRARFNLDTDISRSVEQLSRLARNAQDFKDPYAALYYYFCFDLSNNNKSKVLPADTTTFLSRGFKYMQKRANEIEDNGVREQFMQNPTWNSRLYRSARENMLI